MQTDVAAIQNPLDAVRVSWEAAWPTALSVWSRYTQLSSPRWCITPEQESAEQLTGSFAMIRLVDHAVVISLRQVAMQRLERFAVEVLAHEIGHHVYCPADLSDNARLLARTRVGLPTRETHAPLIANLYTDLLINDRLQRSGNLDMVGVYRALGADQGGDRLWSLYQRIYEVLWSLPRGTLANPRVDARLDSDAVLGARVVRSYAKDWLDGSGRFACLCLPYLLENAKAEQSSTWHDTRDAGRGGLPSGLAAVDPDELAGAIHPANDPALSGDQPPQTSTPASDANNNVPIAATQTGRKALKESRRSPVEYADILRASGVDLDASQLVPRYYRELAMPHLIRFPMRERIAATEPTPEGLDRWEHGNALDDIDWLGTISASPIVIPGVTTRERTYGSAPGSDPEKVPVNLYLGIDCSGSMGNPNNVLSYPILAGTIVALSALRAGASVKVVLSGEPGRTIQTDGFIRDESGVLTMLTTYLGTGMTFGVHRLAETFSIASSIPVHVLIVTDNDLFSLLDAKSAKEKAVDGWQIAKRSLDFAGGGGTIVLQLPQYLTQQAGAQTQLNPRCDRLRLDGWALANVDSMEGLLSFARAFSERTYAKTEGMPR